MNLLTCSKCKFEKPVCEYLKEFRNPAVCRRCLNGKAARPSAMTPGITTVKPHQNRQLCGLRYPCESTPSEFEVQSFIFQTLKLMGWDVRGEVPVKGRSRRLDLVVFDKSKNPIRIIEVKRSKRSKNSKTDQITEYRRYGVDLDLVCGMKAAIEYCSKWSDSLPPKPKIEKFANIQVRTEYVVSP